jgi:2-keto-4-pentenoate hydratase/2-oxohepta-3-ene-1,7-dioic acid hydratase in catechol pathway
LPAVNGEWRQQDNTRDLIVNIQQMVSIASSDSTLYFGDLIATGTPDGVGRVVADDVVTIDVTQVAYVGRMSVPVVQSTSGANVVFGQPYDLVRIK